MMVVFLLSFAYNLEEYFVRDVYLAVCKHSFLALFLLFAELHFASDVAAIHVLRDIFLHG